jgi:hypothetical protein
MRCRVLPSWTHHSPQVHALSHNQNGTAIPSDLRLACGKNNLPLCPGGGVRPRTGRGIERPVAPVRYGTCSWSEKSWGWPVWRTGRTGTRGGRARWHGRCVGEADLSDELLEPGLGLQGQPAVVPALHLPGQRAPEHDAVAEAGRLAEQLHVPRREPGQVGASGARGSAPRWWGWTSSRRSRHSRRARQRRHPRHAHALRAAWAAQHLAAQRSLAAKLLEVGGRAVEHVVGDLDHGAAIERHAGVPRGHPGVPAGVPGTWKPGLASRIAGGPCWGTSDAGPARSGDACTMFRRRLTRAAGAPTFLESWKKGVSRDGPNHIAVRLRLGRRIRWVPHTLHRLINAKGGS